MELNNVCRCAGNNNLLLVGNNITMGVPYAEYMALMKMYSDLQQRYYDLQLRFIEVKRECPPIKQEK